MTALPVTLEYSRTGTDVRAVQASRVFVHIAFILAICLQRFGISIGEGALFLGLPIFAAAIGWAYMTGLGELRGHVLALYAFFAASALFSTLVGLILPDARFDISVASLAAILVSYTLLTIGPGARFDRAQVLPIFLFYARLCAILGICQYLLQFAGVMLFSFKTMLPALEPVLLERLYNHTPIVGYGSSVLRANGFFLVEPSTFSQLLALAFAIEFLVFKRFIWLPVYGLAYALSYSGTGLLVLAIGVTIYAIVEWEKLRRLSAFLVLGVLIVFAIWHFLPDQFASFADRADEFSSQRSSAYNRYFAQFALIERYGVELRAFIGWGAGAMERADGYVPGSGNPSLKLFLDYGLLGLALFWAFLISATWRRGLSLIPILLLVQFQLGGGSLLFTPLLILIAMLCIWSGEPPDAQRETHA